MRTLVRLAFFLTLLFATPSLAAVNNATATSSAMAYLKAHQRADGGFEGFTPGSSDDFTTLRSVMATASAGYVATYLRSSAGTSAFEYLVGRAKAYVQDDQARTFPGRAGQVAVAVAAAGGNATSFGGLNLVNEIQGTYNSS